MFVICIAIDLRILDYCNNVRYFLIKFRVDYNISGGGIGISNTKSRSEA